MAYEQAVVSDDTQTSPALKVHMEPRCRLRALLAIQKLHTETSGVLKLVIIARFLISWLYDSKRLAPKNALRHLRTTQDAGRETPERKGLRKSQVGSVSQALCANSG
eukprot:scaffold14465_cov107-Isochrysis_galbana.AAC.1